MIRYDYSDVKKDVAGKAARLTAINALKEMAKENKYITGAILPHMDETMHMIETNIFRYLPRVNKIGF